MRKIPTNLFVRNVDHETWLQLRDLIRTNPRFKGFHFNGYNLNDKFNLFFMIDDRNLHSMPIYGATNTSHPWFMSMSEFALDELFQLLGRKKPKLPSKPAKHLEIHSTLLVEFL